MGFKETETQLQEKEKEKKNPTCSLVTAMPKSLHLYVLAGKLINSANLIHFLLLLVNLLND